MKEYFQIPLPSSIQMQIPTLLWFLCNIAYLQTFLCRGKNPIQFEFPLSCIVHENLSALRAIESNQRDKTYRITFLCKGRPDALIPFTFLFFFCFYKENETTDLYICMYTLKNSIVQQGLFLSVLQQEPEVRLAVSFSEVICLINFFSDAKYVISVVKYFVCIFIICIMRHVPSSPDIRSKAHSKFVQYKNNHDCHTF